MKHSLLNRILNREYSLATLARVGLVTLVLGNVVLIGGVLIGLGYQSYIDRTLQLQQIRSKSIASRLENYLDDIQLHLDYLTKVRGLSQFDRAAQRGLMEGIVRDNQSYESIALFNRQGQLLTVVAPYMSDQAAAIELTNTYGPLVTTVLTNQSRYVTPVDLYSNAQHPTIKIAIPIHNQQDQLDGVLVAQVNLNFLDFVVSKNRIGTTGYVYILDRRNIVLAKTKTTAQDSQNFQFKTVPPSVAQQTTENRTNPNQVRDYLGLTGVPVLGVTNFISSIQWYVVVELPLEEVYAPVQQWGVVLLGALLISIAISIGISIAITRSLIRPLTLLTTAAKKIRNGDYQTTVTIHHKNELGTLAATFNSMTSEIQTVFADLGQKNDHLAAALSELQQAQGQLVQSEKMSGLGQLVAGVAHEINNPVNFIYANITHAQTYTDQLLAVIAAYRDRYPEKLLIKYDDQTIDDEELDFIIEDFAQLLTSMQVGASRIREIVISLRNFARLDESDYKQADIHEGIDNTLIILGSRLKGGKGRSAIEVEKNYGDLPLVTCYPGQLNQAIMNLLSNAIDALEDKMVQCPDDRIPMIRVLTQCLDDQWITIQIQDNAGGIPEAIRHHIFDPFFTTKEVGKGTGLGLSISYTIVQEKHGGRLTCESALGVGTTFTIAIPMGDSVHQALPPRPMAMAPHL